MTAITITKPRDLEATFGLRLQLAPGLDGCIALPPQSIIIGQRVAEFVAEHNVSVNGVLLYWPNGRVQWLPLARIYMGARDTLRVTMRWNIE